jgi:hypothetical protein
MTAFVFLTSLPALSWNCDLGSFADLSLFVRSRTKAPEAGRLRSAIRRPTSSRLQGHGSSQPKELPLLILQRVAPFL